MTATGRRSRAGTAWLARSRWAANAASASAYAADAWALLAVMWNIAQEHATSHRWRPIESAGGTWVYVGACSTAEECHERQADTAEIGAWAPPGGASRTEGP